MDGGAPVPPQPVAPVQPGMPAMGQPMPPQPGMPPMGQPMPGAPVTGAIPMQPMMQASAGQQPVNMAMYQQPVAPSAGDQVIGKVVEMYKAVWKGETARAIDMLSELRNFWIIALATLSVVVGFVMGFTRSRFSGALNADLLDSIGEDSSYLDGAYQNTYLGFGIGKTIGIILAGILVVALVYVARAYAITLVAKTRKVEYSFSDAMNLIGFAFMPVVLVYVLGFVLALIPTSGAVWAANMLIAGGMYPLILLGELLTYVAFNRQKRFNKSIVVPHVALSAAAVLAAGIIWQIAKMIFGF